MDDRLPASERLRSLGQMTDHLGRVKKEYFPLDRYRRLSELSEDYLFFTPALLYLYGSFLESMWLDYMAELGETVRLLHHKFEKPLFEGLHTPDGDRDWDYVLWFVERPYYESLEDFLCSLSVSRRDQRRFCRYGVQRLAIYDPLFADRQKLYDPLPREVTVNVFGVTALAGRLCLQATADLRTPPRLVCLPPDADLRAFARGYFEDRNPFAVRDEYRLQRQRETHRETPV